MQKPGGGRKRATCAGPRAPKARLAHVVSAFEARGPWPPHDYLQNTLYNTHNIAENLRVKPSLRRKYYVIRNVLVLILAGFLFNLTVSAQFINPDETTKPAEAKSEPAKPMPAKTEIQAEKIVRNIKAELVSSDKNQVRINWTQAADVKDDFIVARANYPISSGDLLLSAKSVAVLPPGIVSYTDTVPENGSWYYAVVSRGMVADRKMVLLAAENYTGIPVTVNVVTRSSEQAPPQVTLIYAQYSAENNSVRISWKGVGTPDTSYVIYRSIESLGTPGAVDRALRIGLLRNGAEFFEDRTIPGPGQYYYGVTTRSATGAEDVKLIPDQSYIREPVKVGSSEIPVTTSIIAAQDTTTKGVVLVRYAEPETAESGSYTYILYRSNSPITGERDILSAEKISEIKAGVSQYKDTLPGGGKFTYAIVTKDSKGRISNRFSLGANVTHTPVSIQINKESPSITVTPTDTTTEKLFSGLQVYTREKSAVLSWQVRSDIPQGTRTHVYRFVQIPNKLPDIIRGTLVGKLSADSAMFEDFPEEKGVYYYALLLETPRGLKPEGFIKNENLIGPITVQGKTLAGEETVDEEIQEEEPPEVKPVFVIGDIAELNRVIRTTYLAGEYSVAVSKLSPYTRHKDKKTRSKAIFYTGLSYYHAGNFEKALPCFLNKDVTTAYRKNARFWYRRTVEKIR